MISEFGGEAELENPKPKPQEVTFTPRRRLPWRKRMAAKVKRMGRFMLDVLLMILALAGWALFFGAYLWFFT